MKPVMKLSAFRAMNTWYRKAHMGLKLGTEIHPMLLRMMEMRFTLLHAL
jgi:hypothetical protein